MLAIRRRRVVRGRSDVTVSTEETQADPDCDWEPSGSRPASPCTPERKQSTKVAKPQSRATARSPQRRVQSQAEQAPKVGEKRRLTVKLEFTPRTRPRTAPAHVNELAATRNDTYQPECKPQMRHQTLTSLLPSVDDRPEAPQQPLCPGELCALQAAFPLTLNSHT
ncbi:hypothetical protein WJX73_009924 [Symbiochloris irregularis]|uniref:Uncharacterized protein n=1 Tax=Symbiochloris irregularis TaxID=706552 RepID=A0AAW1NV86_9CHLO